MTGRLTLITAVLLAFQAIVWLSFESCRSKPAAS